MVKSLPERCMVCLVVQLSKDPSTSTCSPPCVPVGIRAFDALCQLTEAVFLFPSQVSESQMQHRLNALIPTEVPSVKFEPLQYFWFSGCAAVSACCSKCRPLLAKLTFKNTV